MSLQGLISGSECAVPFNPLSQVLKHTDGDRSVQQDRVAGPSSSRLQHLPSTASAPGAERDLALARQFFEGNVPSGPSVAFALAPHLPHMEAAMRSGADLSKAWNDIEGHPLAQVSQVGPQMNSHWAAEFSSNSSASMAGLAQTSGLQRPEYNQSSYMQSSMYRPMMGSGYMYGSGYSPAVGIPLQMTDKGKGKDIDFEAAFAEATASFSNQADSGRIVEVKDDVADLADVLQEANITERDGTQGEANAGDFKSIWDQMQSSDIPPPQEDMAKWEAQFNQIMNSQRDGDEAAGEYGEFANQLWNQEAGTYDWSDESKVEFDNEGLPIMGNYTFENENKYLDPSASGRSHLQAAKDLLEQNGSLSEVASLLEAAIQKGELGEGGYETWIMLGEVKSMDEHEDAAMRALAEGVKRAEAAGATGQGMLSLAISYTNESYERASHTVLLRWLHARFPDYPIPEDAWKSLTGAGWHSHERVTEAFLGLAREQYGRGEMDPDVQTALGVLFYTSSEFDRAKDCFEAALTVRPKDYLLWNRLGSSLSNGSKPEEALGAYREALQLRPTYTRAIYNVGVACLNIGLHKEAAEHMLGALAMQEVSGGAKSEQLWYTLRRVFQSMGRPELADMAKSTTDIEAFRKEGFDF
ncbi:peroxisome targeting signal receptor [Fomitopsis betulina]|nr:peroxisome targeting signal receptor [Fomitopsis betulina]